MAVRSQPSKTYHFETVAVLHTSQHELVLCLVDGRLEVSFTVEECLEGCQRCVDFVHLAEQLPEDAITGGRVEEAVQIVPLGVVHGDALADVFDGRGQAPTSVRCLLVLIGCNDWDWSQWMGLILRLLRSSILQVRQRTNDAAVGMTESVDRGVEVGELKKGWLVCMLQGNSKCNHIPHR